MIETRSRSYIILSILFLLALAIRLIYLFELSRIPIFDTVLSVMDHYNFDQGVALHEMSPNMGGAISLTVRISCCKARG